MPDALTQLETITLIALTDRPRYGYEMVQRIAELTDERISLRPGNLYRVLHRLEERGWIASAWGVSDTNRKARYYQLTSIGKKQLATESSRWETLTRAVARAMRPVNTKS